MECFLSLTHIQGHDITLCWLLGIGKVLGNEIADEFFRLCSCEDIETLEVRIQFVKNANLVDESGVT